MAGVLVAVAAGAGSGGCGGSGEQPETTGTVATTTRSEPEPPNAGGRPPRPGDGAGGVELAKIGDFEQPLYVTQAPGERESVYVVEQCGRIQRLPLGGGAPSTFLDVSDRIACGGEQGLLSVAFAPDHATSGLLYVYYTDTEGTARIVEYARSPGEAGAADPQSAREVLAIEDFAANHNGGLLVFGPDGNLYAGTGDGGGGGDPERTAQDLSSLLGKILRINPRESAGEAYTVPKDNPHTNEDSARPEVVIDGMRNPWRFSFDRETGDLWIGDVGQDELEEIDSAPAGSVLDGLDFGWSAFEGTQRFNEDQQAPDALPPTLEYPNDGGCSVTGGYVVRDPELRSLYGRYLYGDYCAGELRSFTAAPGREASDDRPLGLEISSLSSFGEDASGHVYATSLAGPVYRLVPAKGAG